MSSPEQFRHSTLRHRPEKQRLAFDQEETEQATEDDVAISVDSVSMSFNMASEQLNSLKEYFIKILRHELFFKEFVALDNISFTVNKGDVYGIVGTNGSGKSTILKIIAGVLEPTRGTCTIHGSIAPLIELGAGFDLELTARENIYLNGALLGYSHSYIDEHFDEIVDFAELEEFLDLPMKNYSSGMVARIAFSIATVIVPDILIVDEALAVGDVFFQEKCERRINSLISDYGTTVLFVSHSIAQVERICQKAIWIEKGKKVMEGPVDKVCRTYRNMEYVDYMESHGLLLTEKNEPTEPCDTICIVDVIRTIASCIDSKYSSKQIQEWMSHNLATDQTFTTNEPLSRKQAAEIIRGFVEYRRPNSTANTDLSILGPYSDINNCTPSEKETLAWCVTNNLLLDTTATDGSLILGLEQPITRVDFARMLTKMFRECLDYQDDVSPTFDFVRSGAYDFVIREAILLRYPSGQFGVQDGVLRGDVLYVLWRCADCPPYDDVLVAPATRAAMEASPVWMGKAIAWAHEQKLPGTENPPAHAYLDKIEQEEFLELASAFADLVDGSDVRSTVAHYLEANKVRKHERRPDESSPAEQQVSRAALAATANLLGHLNQDRLQG